MTTSSTNSTTRRLGGALLALGATFGAGDRPAGPRRSFASLLAAPLLGLALLPASALAADFLVTTLDDSGPGSLRQAILDANANGAADTITFDATLAGGTIALSSGALLIGDLMADTDLIIDGSGAPGITIDAGGNHRVFSIETIDSNATLEGLVITGGDTVNSGNQGFGGGILNTGTTLTITNSTISGNRAQTAGGGIYNRGTLTVTNSTISDNTAEFTGGGISNVNTATVTGSTITRNVALAEGGDNSGRGGGIRNDIGSLTVANSTISGNSAAIGGGIENSETTQIKSTIVAGNTATDGADCFNDGTLTSLGFNLEGGTSCGFAQTSDQHDVAVDGVLATDASGAALLADNGGPTRTIALLDAASNPALDAIPFADCDVDTDQRGVARPQPADGDCDIGAFELEQAASITIAAVKDSFLRRGAPNLNEGANPGLRLQAAGDNRVVVGFDPAAIDGFGSVTTATLELTIAEIANNWGRQNDRTVDAHPLAADFAEGDGQNAGVPGAQSTRGSGSGVTWNCAIDAEIANLRPDCASRWNGGSFGPATADRVLHVNGLSGEVSWDVTADVQAGASAWLIKKTDERQPGRVSYHSKEGADPALAPRLVLE